MRNTTDRPEVDTDTHALHGTALRYAAGELPPAESRVFEVRLAVDQQARDALAEAVRLSAMALGQSPPIPDHSYRAMIRDRVRPIAPWLAHWWDRKTYRGHPLAWVVLGAGLVVVCTYLGYWQVQQESDSPADLSAGWKTATPSGDVADDRPSSLANASEQVDAAATPGTESSPSVCDSNPATPRAAEIWADLSTPDHLEKDHEDEFRLRNRIRELQMQYPAKLLSAGTEPREP